MKGFRVDKKLVESRKWRKLEKKILSGEVTVTENSSQLEKAVARKLMTVDGLCLRCKAEDELYKENINQNPINVACGKCHQRYSYVEVVAEDGAWFI